MINLNFEIIEKGWVKSIVSNEERDITIFASHLSNGLMDLIVTVFRLINGEKEVCCDWQEEPGQYRWVFTIEESQVRLRILWFDNTFSGLLNENGYERFSGTENFIVLTRKLIRAFDKLKHEYGIDEYKRVWTYEFPEKELEKLKLLYKILKNKI